MQQKTLNNQRFWTNSLHRAALPNLAVKSAGRSLTVTASQTGKRRWNRKEGSTYDTNRQPLFISPMTAFSSSCVLLPSQLRGGERSGAMRQAERETMNSLWQKKTKRGHGSKRQSHLTESMSQLTAQEGFLIALRVHFSSLPLVIGHERRW